MRQRAAPIRLLDTKYELLLNKILNMRSLRQRAAPIRLLGVSIHAEEGSVYRFDDIPYSHKVYVLLPSEVR